MAYRLKYSDYITTASGPPDPAAWVGPPGPPGPPGPMPPGGPFLPLSGGTVAGSIRGMADQNLGAGGPFQAYLGFASNISGVRSGGDSHLSGIVTYTDTLDAGGGGLVGSWIDLNSGGGSVSGNRVGQYIRTQFTGSTLDKVRGYPGQYAGQWVYAHASGNVGGTALGASFGNLWGGLSSATLESGATFWSYCVGHEINVGVSAGASAPFVQAFKIAVQNHDQPSNATDFLFGMGKITLADQQFRNGIVFGTADSYWPLTNTGTMIGTQASVLATPPPMTAAYGVDLYFVQFTGAAFRSQGFQVNGTGGISFSGGSASAYNDFSKHLELVSGQAGINAGSGNIMNYVAPIGGAHMFYQGSTQIAYFNSAGLNVTGSVTTSTTLTADGVATLNAGLRIADFVATGGVADLSHHIQLGYSCGFNITGGRLNYSVTTGNSHAFVINSVDRFTINSTGLGFNGTAAVAKPTVTGAKGSNAALASLMTALAAYGLVTDSTTA